MVLSDFCTDFNTFVTLYNTAVSSNKRRAAILEETIDKLHNEYGLFNMYGRDGDYTKSLTHYQAMLTLLDVAVTEDEWLITTANLQTFFGVTTISSDQPFHTDIFANPLSLNISIYKNHKCVITGSTEVTLTGLVNGDSGAIVLKIDNVGEYSVTLNSNVFTLMYGSTPIDTTATTSNLISWTYDGSDVHYTVLNATPLA
jgi:hypothetical protein